MTATGCVACGEGGGESTEPETAFDPMTETLDRAREVDDIARSRVDVLEEQIEASEAAGDP
ncbi:MAG TPA: hypothetical protein VM616_08050 [Gammaproteobacteria bacterium]|nr:hypothetical protein [Gammaproteobacteria bacterium]